MSNPLIIAETRTCNKSQGGNTIIIGPSPARRPLLVSPGLPSPPPRSPSSPGLPPSTALPRLEQERVQEQELGRGKRKRVYTKTYEAG
jgi:hypothetical protein